MGKSLIILPILILSVELLVGLFVLLLQIFTLLQNPLIVIIEFLKANQLAFLLEVISILITSIPLILIVVFRQIIKRISSRKFILVTILLLFFTLITMILWLFTALDLYFFGNLDPGGSMARELPLYRGIYAEPWIRYKDIQAGISYSYPSSKNFNWKILNNTMLKSSHPRWLYSNPPNTILYSNIPYWGLAFLKNPTKENIEIMTKDEDVKKTIIINNEAYSAYGSDPSIDVDHLVDANILLSKNQSLAIGIITPTDIYPIGNIYNKLFLKIIESIKKN